MNSLNLFFTVLAACLLCVNTTSGLSFHLLTAPTFTAFVLSYAVSFLTGNYRKVTGFFIGEVIVTICLVDCYCQDMFMTQVTPQILSNVLLSDSRETREFLSTFIGSHLLSSWRITAELSLVILLPLSYLSFINRRITVKWSRMSRYAVIVITSLCFIYELPSSYRFLQLFWQRGDLKSMEGLIFRHYHEKIPTPLHRFAFACYSLQQSSQQLEEIKRVTFTAQIDSCIYMSPHIVFVIGESYNKHHSTLYGYHLQTTPRQQELFEDGKLFVFHDVVTPWNITSNVFLDLFSMWEFGMPEPIVTKPLFPMLFRRAGYSVNFFSNQYLLKGFRKGVTNQAGHFFLADREMSDSLFTFRNRKRSKYDIGLVEQISDFKNSRNQTECTLDIIHLIGQHFDYSIRYPKIEATFSIDDYSDRDISKDEKNIVMHYDNATHYNDLVLDNIINIYRDDDAIILFVSDHGEEVYDDLKVNGRLFQEPTAAQAKNEHEVPMWIWCSKSYRCSHPEIIQQIEQSHDKPFMTDGLPQLLLYLAGISSKWNQEDKNLLSPNYHCKKRIICGSIDYDQLIKRLTK
ncbi:phosphoethanolamine transferase [Prevotella sp. E13-27]|uniref:phosphoethanolamine transferase n=1 Tax=Prevotella sp. E13-27 TaxID=2938122 RepID=UPI00200B3AD0|nr:phosphoethanolamine transferase [Prevotella sp. E13-27]MCK8622207.1 phosphoethanolamine transferase [Prevotella sp. E13-27]